MNLKIYIKYQIQFLKDNCGFKSNMLIVENLENKECREKS